MLIHCRNPECGHKFNLPDEKLPSRPVKISCPQCRTPTPVRPAGQEPPAQKRCEAPEDAALLSSEAKLRETIFAIMDERLSQLPPDLMREWRNSGAMVHENHPAAMGPGGIPSESGGNRALICDDDSLIRAQVSDALSQLGFISDEAKTAEEGIRLIRETREMNAHYSMVIIDKVFPDNEEGGYEILSEIADLPLTIRRKCYVAFISAQLKTRDASTAFLTGANIVINKKDLHRLSGILKEETGHYDNLYKVFNHCLNNRKKE